jgi:hypothetical protein
MLARVLWWSGLAMLVTLLSRAFFSKLFRKYPFFYGYVTCVLIKSLAAVYFFVRSPDAYRRFYWRGEFFTVFLSFGVTWEIYAQLLAYYSGARRFARVLLSGVLVALLSILFVNIVTSSVWMPASDTAEFSRNLRVAQALMLMIVVGLVMYYSIPLGSNLRGIIFGYGLFVAADLINLSLRMHLGTTFQMWWSHLRPLVYLISLAIWCVTLWSYQPNPAPCPDLEEDYDWISRQTLNSFTRVRNYLLATIRL